MCVWVDNTLSQKLDLLILTQLKSKIRRERERGKGQCSSQFSSSFPLSCLALCIKVMSTLCLFSPYWSTLSERCMIDGKTQILLLHKELQCIIGDRCISLFLGNFQPPLLLDNWWGGGGWGWFVGDNDWLWLS